VSKNASTVGGTSAMLREGQRLSIYDLLHGLMLPSGNDAAMVLAEHFGRYFVLDKAKTNY
jgi:D-alanyl-D-alanine carboxypeptidase